MAIKISNDTVIYDDKVFKVGSGTTAQRPGTPASGMVRYNTDLAAFEGYHGTVWSEIGGTSNNFNTKIRNFAQAFPSSWETTVFQFPSTAGKRYIIESITVANVYSSNQEVNIITNIRSSIPKSHIAYNVPIASGGLIELIKEPIVVYPSDEIRSWVTNTSYSGIANAAEMYITYREENDTNYFRELITDDNILSGELTTVYTSTSNSSVLQSLYISNKTDSGDYTVSVALVNGAGTTTTYIAKNLIIPRYAVVNILDKPKYLELNGTIKIQMGQVSTLDFIISGKKILG